MNIQYADQSIDTRGENQFPGQNGSSVSYETDQFKRFLEAIRALIGGLPFH